MKLWFILLLSFSSSLFAVESINSFDVIIEPHPDHMLVTEKIEYNFPKGEKRHGIYRDIKTIEKRELLGKSLNYNIKIKMLSITDENEKKYRYKKISIRGGTQFKIGSPSIKVTGVKTYILKYKVYGAYHFFENYDEIYWNVTGNYWSVPILRTTVKVIKPEGFKTLSDKVNVFYGYRGKKNTLPYNDEKDFFSEYNHPLKIREGVSISISIKKGFFEEPQIIEKLFYFIPKMGNLIIAVFFPLFLGLLYFFIHRKVGKELEKTGSIVVQYEPPKDLTPTEAGVLINDKFDSHDFAAMIIDLAIRGHIEIHEKETNSLLKLFTPDIEFKIQINSQKQLHGFEKFTLNKLSSYGSNGNVKQSDLKNKFYKDYPKIIEKVYARRLNNVLYTLSPFQTVYYIAPFFVFTMVLSPIIALAIKERWFDIEYVIFSFFICFIMTLIYAKFLPRKSRLGLKTYRHCLGYKEFIEKVDVPTLKNMMAKDQLLLEKTLPYAMAFGLEDKWLKKFDGFELAPPDWYRGHGFSKNFSAMALSTALSSTVGSINSSFSSSTSSGGAGGGSGGGGGGSW